MVERPTAAELPRLEVDVFHAPCLETLRGPVGCGLVGRRCRETRAEDVCERAEDVEHL